MQSELERSIKLDPNFADAYNILAFTCMAQGKSDEALAAMRGAVALNPRNEQYQFNFAHLYLERREFDEATSILRALQTSADPQVAARSSEELARMQSYREQTSLAARLSAQDMTNAPMMTPSSSPESEPEPVSPAVAGAAKFLRGRLLSVDCSHAPTAMLTILAGSTNWKMRVADSSKAIVIGADQFSCDWKNRKVAVNYKAGSGGEGDLVSLEVQ